MRDGIQPAFDAAKIRKHFRLDDDNNLLDPYYTVSGWERAAAMLGEIDRLESLALQDDCYRCEGCARVFGVDDIVFGEDCELCIHCVAEIANAHA